MAGSARIGEAAEAAAPSPVEPKAQGAFLRFKHGVRETLRLVLDTPRLSLASTDYDEYWQAKRKGDAMGSISEFQRARARWILPRISEGARVLDCGCGDGAVLFWLAAHKTMVPMGADISAYSVDFLRSRGVEASKVDMGDPDCLEALPEADHIILFEVLEHMQNPELFLRAAVAKARRSVFFSVPNTGYFPYRLRLLMGRFPVQWRLHPGEHLRFWTFRDLRWWLGQLGFAERAEADVYKGVPLLNRAFKNLFGMGIVGEIRK